MKNRTGAAILLAAALAAGGAVAKDKPQPKMSAQTVATLSTQNSNSSAGEMLPFLIMMLILIGLISGGSGTMYEASDRRLKRDIRRVGTTANGLPLYRFRYRIGRGVYEGVMAQDVAAVRPDAVKRMPLGYLAVNYRALGLNMRRVA